MTRVLLTGGSGFVGTTIKNKLSDLFHITSPTRKELDLTNINQVQSFFDKNKFDWIINCAVNGGRRIRTDTYEDFYNNIVSLNNLLPFIKNDCKLITFSSGAEIYKQDEFYGYSKKVCTQIIKNKQDIKNLRIYNLFGEYGMKDSFVYSTIKKCISNDDIIIWEDMFFDIYPADNLLNILKLLIYNNTQDFQEIDCVYLEKYRLSEIATLIKRLCGSNSQIFIEKFSESNYIGKYQDLDGLQLIELEKSLKNLIEYIKHEKI